MIERLSKRLHMRFDDPAIALQYANYNAVYRRGYQRAAMMIGLCLWCGFAILDLLLGGPSSLLLLAMRLGLALPLGALAVYGFAHRSFGAPGDLWISCYLLSGALAICAMIAVCQAEVALAYPVGVLLVMVVGPVFLMHNYVYSAFTNAGMSAALIGALLIADSPGWSIWSSAFYSASLTIVMMIASFIIERMFRERFRMLAGYREARSRAMRMYQDAQAANHAKGQFLALVSHELRTPLNAIIGFSEIMSKEMLGPIGSAQYREYSGDIHKSGTHLLSIINDIIDLSRTELGKLTFEKHDFALSPILQDSMRLTRGLFEEKHLLFEADIAPDISLYTVSGDARRLRQALHNLLTNALKFTPQGGSVLLSCHPTEEGGVAISVSDTGPGVAPALIARVREPFVQAEDAFSRHNEGLGLGLALADRVAKSFDGSLDLLSPPGKGLCARIVIPPARVVAATLEPERVRA